MHDASQAAGWRASWPARNWLGAMPLLRAIAAPAPRRAFDEIGADIAMIAGMLFGMDLGATEVSFLRAAEAGLAPGLAGAEAAAFGSILSFTMVATMVLGMGLGMLLWETLSPLLGIEKRAMAERRKRPTSQLRRALVYIPCLRSFCEPSFRQGCITCLGDSMMILGMMMGVAVAHHLMSGSAGPVTGLSSAFTMALAMTLGMGVGLALWNSLTAVAAATLGAARVPHRQA
jgi:hypothetical protein